MTKKRTTKHALLMSALSLLLCVSMLVGSTFAWFTDSVTSGNNVIKSGNLDLVVAYTLDGENWDDLDGADDLFKKGLWEPGHTEVVALRIENKGSLALKYVANMNIIKETVGKTAAGADITLSDILTVSTLVQQAVDADGNANQIGDITMSLAFSGENSVAYENTTAFKAGNVLRNDVELQPGAAHYLIIKVDMAETVGNEANHNGTEAPAIHFGINVLATQFTYENDSFGNQYDKDAEYEGTAAKVGTYADLLAALTEGGSIQLMSDIVVEDSVTVISKDTTIDLNGKTITGTRGYDGSNSATAAVLAVSGAEVTLVGKGKVENATANDVQNYAVLVTGGGKVIIEDGTYVGDESAVYVENGEAIIKGGFFEAHKSTSPVPDYNRTWEGQTCTMYLAAVINCSKGAYINYCNGDLDGVWANVDVSGGTFVNEDPSNLYEGWIINETHVIDGYKVVRTEQTNGDAWYTVVAE